MADVPSLVIVGRPLLGDLMVNSRADCLDSEAPSNLFEL